MTAKAFSPTNGVRPVSNSKRSAPPRIVEQEPARGKQAAGGRELHRVIREAVHRFTYLINRHDVRVLEARRRLRFATKTGHDVIGIPLVSQDAFERDDATRM